MKKIIYRARQETPPFFRRLRKVALIVAVCCLAILLSPFQIPHLVHSIASYLLVACLSASVVCQLTVDTDAAFLRWVYGKSAEYLPRFIDKNLLK